MNIINRNSVYFPDYLADRVVDIDIRPLKDKGITHIVFDLDNTLARRRTSDIPQDYSTFIRSLQKAGFTVLIGSNSKRNIGQLAEMLDVIAVQSSAVSYKPFASFYVRVIAQTGTTPDRIVMVGDHVLNDVIGANRAGLTTILVQGLRGKASLFYRIYSRLALRQARHHIR